ncbi:phosphoribosylamine--glycine ligase [Hirschia litorea]|uniref:Phosphoribosylamine--glycine ligase n=1 Tax=Hirschia litorea TaxID=1199156 RepID=A0ABW2IJL0_9PROT
MKILIVGGGGREHALAWRLSKSPKVTSIVCAPGNPGMANVARCIPIKAEDIEGQVRLAKDERPHLVIVGPEVPLAMGLSDQLRMADIPVFGPSKAAAQLESSKGFSKDLMKACGVPTAAYGRFTEADKAKAFLDNFSAPYVLKADGLAAGKGVVIAETREEAEKSIDDMLSGQFGESSAELVIEEFMEGEEASFFVLTDGHSAVPLAGAQDHKRVGEGDTGVNTGGMGAYSPAPCLDSAMQERVMEEIVNPTIKGMRDMGIPYTGVLFVGLMISPEGNPRVVEYNCRFGDPECQVIMARLKGEILPLMLACATGYNLSDCKRPERFEDAAVCVVMATEGYPASYEKGSVIRGLEEAEASNEGVVVFHAGTAERNGDIIANGGRVLGVTAMADTVTHAIENAYKAVDQIDWPEGFYRRDIGWRAKGRG